MLFFFFFLDNTKQARLGQVPLEAWAGGCGGGWSKGLYLDLSDGAGGDLVILQRGGGDGSAGVEGLGKRRHLGSRRDLHAG